MKNTTSNRHKAFPTCLPPATSLLGSWWYWREKDLNTVRPGTSFIADCGAFSAATQGKTVAQSDVTEWVNTWSNKITWAASLDVIGDMDATRRNWEQAAQNYDVECVPTVHYGTPVDEIGTYYREGCRRIGIGGLVGVPEKKRGHYIGQCFKYARDHNMKIKFHGWGVTHPPLLRFPFTSTDSSTWNSGYRYARIATFQQNRNITIMVDGKTKPTSRDMKYLLDNYGIKYEQIRKANTENRWLIGYIGANETRKIEQYYAAKRDYTIYLAAQYDDYQRVSLFYENSNYSKTY